MLSFFFNVSANISLHRCFTKPRNWKHWNNCLIKGNSIQTYSILDSGARLKTSLFSTLIETESSSSNLPLLPPQPPQSHSTPLPTLSPLLIPTYKNLFDGPLTPLPSDESDDESSSCHAKIICIQTNFDYSKNKNFPIQHRSDVKLRQVYTEQERAKAMKAHNPGTLGLFSKKVDVRKS